MDMLGGSDIVRAALRDWRKLAQAFHARYLVDDFSTGARFVAAVGAVGDELGHHPRATIGPGYVDLRLVSQDAVYRDEGTDHVVEWVTNKDVDLARRIEKVADEHGLTADPSTVSVVELGLDTARPGVVAPVWAALLTGDAASQGRGSPSDEVRDATGRVPNLWFGDLPEGASRGSGCTSRCTSPRRSPSSGSRRPSPPVAPGAAPAAPAPELTVVADQDGNTAVVCVTEPIPAEG